MEKCLNNFLDTMRDINALLDLSLTETGRERSLVIFRSAVVLMVAAWEQYVEQLAESSVELLTARLRDASSLPDGVKISVALFSVKQERSQSKEFSKSVWKFADKGWKDAYTEYCKSETIALDTASPNRVRELYKDILGLRDLSLAWFFENLSPKDCLIRMADLVDLRHDIAHGANNRANELGEVYLRSQVEFISKIARDTYTATFDHVSALWGRRALKYSLAPDCYRDIIALAMQKPDRLLPLEEIKTLGSSAQGNHNKLCYPPWGLLEVVDRNTRRITDRLVQFSNSEIRLPLEILVFDNNDAIPAPDTSYVLISELS